MAKKQTTKTGRILIYEKAPQYGEQYGKTSEAFKKLRNKRGVYRIFENRKLVYVGSSNSDIYKTILRKFQMWNDKRQSGGRLYYDAKKKEYKVEVFIMPNASANKLLDTEHHFIQKSKPRDNKPASYSFYNRKDLYEPEKVEQEIKKAPKLEEKQIEEMDYSKLPFWWKTNSFYISAASSRASFFSSG